MKAVGITLAIVGALVAPLFLGCLLHLDFLVNLTVGWALYLIRVVPRLHPNTPDIATALICFGTLAVGLHWFLSWLYGRTTALNPDFKEPRRIWPVRRTATILAITVLMFVAGISALGISHQTAWLATAPAPILDDDGFREAAMRAKTENNLKQMALAMHNYSSLYGTLPAAAIFDKNSQPLLSWRVSILPFIEESALYKEFHLEEPWDSPHNLKLLPHMPSVYAAVSDRKIPNLDATHFRVFTGKQTAFEGRRGLRMDADFPDGTASTFLIVEAAEAVPWTKPEELPYSPHNLIPPLGYLSQKYFLIAMVDGGTRQIEFKKTTEANIRARITRNGGEKITDPDW